MSGRPRVCAKERIAVLYGVASTPRIGGIVLRTTTMFFPSRVLTIDVRSFVKSETSRPPFASFVPSMRTANWASPKAAATVVAFRFAEYVAPSATFAAAVD